MIENFISIEWISHALTIAQIKRDFKFLDRSFENRFIINDWQFILKQKRNDQFNVLKERLSYSINNKFTD